RMRGNAKYAWHPKIVSEVRVGDRRLVCPAERSSASGNVANRRGRNKRKTDRNYDWFANLKVACLDAAGLALAQTRASPPHQAKKRACWAPVRLGLRGFCLFENFFFFPLFQHEAQHFLRNRRVPHRRERLAVQRRRAMLAQRC